MVYIDALSRMEVVIQYISKQLYSSSVAALISHLQFKLADNLQDGSAQNMGISVFGHSD